MREIVNTEVNQLTFEKLTEFKRQFSNEEIVEEEKQNVYNNQQKESEQNRKMNELLQKMRQSTIDYSHLIQEKLKNPHKELSSEDSIGLLVQCIKQGLIEAEKAKGKEIVIFIGNTGAGKSTAVNYLYGCEMELKKPKDLGIKGFEKVVVVKSKASGGRLDELMTIGHTKKSQTFMPQIETDKTNVMTYVDCPGF